MSRIKLAIVGAGKVAQDYHVPAVAGHGAFQLIACASPRGRLEQVPHYDGIEALFDAGCSPDAVAICTPPQARYEIARRCLECGLHVLLEKPPAATLTQVNALVELAQAARGAVCGVAFVRSNRGASGP